MDPFPYSVHRLHSKICLARLSLKFPLHNCFFFVFVSLQYLPQVLQAEVKRKKSPCYAPKRKVILDEYPDEVLSYHLFMSSAYHLIILSFYHLIILSSYHPIIFLSYQLSILSCRCENPSLTSVNWYKKQLYGIQDKNMQLHHNSDPKLKLLHQQYFATYQGVKMYH